MCGIAGLLSVRKILPNEEARDAVLRQMARVQRHRGPDDEGIWHDPLQRCSLAHRRLSIIDTSSAGHQPMLDAHGRWVISFNGEIYNFAELRPHLEAAGVSFRGRTDTEVLLQAIAVWGTDALSRLDGMFAFAAYDRETGQLILARDPFGEKPLYYAELPDYGLAFASELQALEKVPGIDFGVSMDSVAELLMFQYIGAPRTIYRQVKKLPPGHWLVAQPGQAPRIGRYFQFRPGTTGFDSRPFEQLADELEDILLRSLRRRLIADVPLGAFLSGGVDSSTVCALIRRKLGVPLKTYTIGFGGASESEHQTARSFARHLGTEHNERIVAPQASEFLFGIGRLLDEPNADSSCLPTYLLSAFARESLTVALSGDGGDEMFGGYGRYFQTLDESRRHAAAPWHPGNAYYSSRILVSTEEHLIELFGAVPAGTAEHLRRLREALTDPSNPLLCRMRQTDVENYMPGAVLPKVDRMSMQHSLEVRTPFLNTELARFAERLPQAALYAEGRGKRLLREIAYRYLPRELIDLPKQGFGLPMIRWGRKELLGVASQLLESEDSRLQHSLGAAAIARFMKRQRSHNGFATYQVWALAMLESWLRHHPAKLPEWTSVPASRRIVAPQPAWVGVSMDRGVFAVGRKEQMHADGVTSRFWRMAWQAGLADFMSDEARRISARGVELPLMPDRISADADIQRQLSGCTLMFLATDAAEEVSSDLLQAWRSAGIAQLIFQHPFRQDGRSFVRLQFNTERRGWRRLVAWWRLRRAAVASWWGFFARRSHEGRLFIAGPIRRLAGPENAELSHRYAMFEGPCQLPPLPASHEKMAQNSDSRYSIWSSCCLFKPQGSWPRLRHYWLVEQTEATRDLLPIAVDLIEPAEHATSGFVDTLRLKVAAQTAPAPPRLLPNDPVVVFTHSLQPGGAERQWCYLAIGLQRRGFNVHFVVNEILDGDDAHYRSLLEPHGIVPIEIGRYAIRKKPAQMPRDPYSLRLLNPQAGPFDIRLTQLSACMVELRPKAVFAQLDTVNVAAGVAAIVAEVPRCVLSFRNFNPTHFSYLRNDWFLPCYQALLGSPRILLSGNSRAAIADYAAWLGVSEGRIAFVPNCLPVDGLKAPDAAEIAVLREALGIAVDTPVILGVFRLSEEKDPRTFLHVCEAVARAIPGLRVLIAGRGPLQADLEGSIDSLGLERKVTLLGRRTDVPALMSVASLLLLTSTHEGMPNVVMEAHAAGLPVVATRAGGTSDIVDDRITGYLHPVGDVLGLTEACIAILRDRNLRETMSTGARARMSENFSAETMINRYIELVSASNAPPRKSVEDAAFSGERVFKARHS